MPKRYVKVADRKPGIVYDKGFANVPSIVEQIKLEQSGRISSTVEQPPLNIVFKPEGNQILAWEYLTDSSTTELLYGGPANCGKSYVGCAWILYNAIKYPGSRNLIGRNKLSELETTTLKTLFKLMADWGLGEQHYDYNQQKHIITLNFNKSEIILKDMFPYPADASFTRLAGLEINSCYLDECSGISLMAKNIVQSRIRHKLTEYGILPKILLCTNPGRGWIYDDFYKPYITGALPHYRKFVQGELSDNPKQNQNYLDALQRLDPISVKRLYKGEWDYEDDYALFKYDSILEMFRPSDEFPPLNSDMMYLSVDTARLGKDSTIAFVWNGLNVVEIVKLPKGKSNETKDRVVNIMNRYNIPANHVVIDSDGSGSGVSDYIPGCIAFMNNSKPTNNLNYQNLKTQCYFKLAELCNSGLIKIFNCHDVGTKSYLMQELEIIKADKVDLDTKLCIISKEHIKRMINRSPDYSDAMMFHMVNYINSKSQSGEFYMKTFSIAQTELERKYLKDRGRGYDRPE